MDRDTLFAALVGALIATIPILISNLVQIILHASEMRQKNREAKLQAREKWIERDILTIMELIERLVRFGVQNEVLDLQLSSLKKRIKTGPRDSDKTHREKLAVYREQADNLYGQAQEVADRLGTLVYALDDAEIHNKFAEFLNARNQYSQNKKSSNSATSSWIEVVERAGYLHKVLRDYLISIRDA